MKGSPSVIQQLQQLLSYELASIHQYFIHSEMYKDKGLNELFQRIHHEMQEEEDHARKLIQRLLLLESTPDVERIAKMNVGHDVESMLKNDLDLEFRGREIIIESISICEKEKDFESREIFESLLNDTEEDHIYWLEQQIGLIGLIGIENYCQRMMGSSSET